MANSYKKIYYCRTGETTSGQTIKTCYAGKTFSINKQAVEKTGQKGGYVA